MKSSTPGIHTQSEQDQLKTQHLVGQFYGREIRASAILNGDVEPLPECYDLYHILDEYTDAYTADWTSNNMRPKLRKISSVI
ncbi:hypothetical protein JOQ06_002016 [Pogonophryne albipinna]|uniref:Uncharacterized protein n=1 Tax=Pogonophryne albipinna TaxID=1090488 RepID=A0AAD6ABT8_9TELE|nr:hypothetical protein JOQ06_002016 [Pogonophryne albipinna]